MTDYQTIPECAWPCRLDPEDPTGNTIDLNDGSVVSLRSEEGLDSYVWHDIDGGEIGLFFSDSVDFQEWDQTHRKLKAISNVQLS